MNAYAFFTGFFFLMKKYDFFNEQNMIFYEKLIVLMIFSKVFCVL